MSGRSGAGGGVRRRGVTLGTQVGIGVALGAACGLFFGDMTAPLEVAGEVYVGLLQMTVLPYVILSLVERIGNLSIPSALRLGRGAGWTLLVLWAIALAAVLVFPLALPEWDSGTFFSPSLVEEPDPLDLIGLYIPINPFHSLAANVVPAVVLFSICLGVALIPLSGKATLLAPLEVARSAVGRIASFIVRLSPYGTFFLTAHATGTQSVEELLQIQAYLALYTAAALLLTLLVLPLLVSAVTPIRYRDVLAEFRAVGLTAFAVGKLFAVLTLVMEGVGHVLGRQGVAREEARASADLYVPLGYSFPNGGRLLTLLFIPFAAWFAGHSLDPSDYPMLLTVGALSLFGSPLVAIPFLLHTLRLPDDLFPLFILSGIWCTRMGDLLGSMHLLSFSLLGAAGSTGQLRLRPMGLARWLGITALAGGLLIVGLRAGLSWSLSGQPPAASRVTDVQLTQPDSAPMEEPSPADVHRPAPLAPGETQLQRLRSEKVLRLGYRPDAPPFFYRNERGQPVGLDLDMMQRFAGELGLALELVPAEWSDLPRYFEEDRIDLAVGGILSALEHYLSFEESIPYMETHIALVVPDHRASEFKTRERLLAHTKLRAAIPVGEGIANTFRREFRQYDFVQLDSDQEFLRGEHPDIDALVTSAEIGSVYSMLYPGFQVVVPDGARRKFPLIVGVRPDAPELKRMLDTWIELRVADGTIDDLEGYWIRGERPVERHRRWSVIRNVLGWVD